MPRSLNWVHYVNENGDFELGSYIYRMLMDLMKHTLDMGTLLSDDPVKLRAFKEQTKSVYKKRWMEIAQALEAFDIIVPCGCPQTEYCRECGGSRYRLHQALSPDQLREIAVAIAPDQDPDLQRKLLDGLARAQDIAEKLFAQSEA